MDVCVTTRTDDKSTGEFSFEVPITNLKHEASDADIVTADIATLRDDTTSEDVLTRTNSGTIVIDETESIEPLEAAVDPNRNKIDFVIDSAIVNDDTILEKTPVIHNEAIVDNDDRIEAAIDFDKAGKDFISKTDSGTRVIDDIERTEPLKTVVDANKNNILTEEGDAIVIDDIISEKTSVIDNNEKISNINLKAIHLDETETNNTPLIQSEADTDVQEIKDSIDIDETQIQNVTVFNRNIIDTEKNIETQNTKANTDINDTENVIDVDETVVLLDGHKTDSDVILLDGNKTDSASTIILDDDEINKCSKGPPKHIVEVIDVEKDTEDCSIVESTVKKKSEHSDVYKDNPLLLELVEKCLDMENTHGMTRVINRTLLVIYKNVDEKYKKSEVFKKILTRTIMQLDVEPEKKFSHIKNLCNELKLHQAKKRVPFITLGDEEDKEQSTSFIPSKRRKIDAVIDLDDDVRSDVQHSQIQGHEKVTKSKHPIGKVYPSIEIDDDSSSDVIYQKNDNDVILLDNNNSNKENSRTKNQGITRKSYTQIKRKKKRGRPRKYDRPKTKNKKNLTVTTMNERLETTDPNYNDINQINVSTSTITSQIDLTDRNIDRISDPGVLLEPRVAVEINTMECNQPKIDAIEAQISNLKQRLEVLEETEVDVDTGLSPYILSEQIKMTILKLYKELCLLTNTEVNKRHEVRLRVLVPGHAEGPVRCLEEFLNDNIDDDGNLPFPDMADVTQCVINANHKYNMQWSRAQIIGEAHALFTQFGRKLQKRRQRREYKDLLSLVKQEMSDPADDDPELLARLEANKRLARKKEHDLLERFVNIEHGFADQPDPELRLSQSGYSGEDTDVDIPNSGTGIITNMNPSAASEINVEPNMLSRFSNNLPDCGVKTVGTINFGSSMSVSDGQIVIQPILNGTPKTPTTDIRPYTPEFKGFILKLNNQPTTFIGVNNHFNLNNNSAQSECADPNSSAKAKEVSPQFVQNTLGEKNADASKLAEEILVLLQSDLCRPVTNCLPTYSNTIKTSCAALPTVNPTVKINLDPIILAKNSVTESLANNATKINECNIQHKLPSSDGFQIYTHKSKHESTQPNVNINTELNTVSTDTTDEDILKIEVEEEMFSTATLSTTMDTLFENDLKKEIVATATKDTSADLDTKNNIIVDGNVKRERLDIPSMLKELGDGFTATIFDIEDPFMVIEISDSSESEESDDEDV